MRIGKRKGRVFGNRNATAERSNLGMRLRRARGEGPCCRSERIEINAARDQIRSLRNKGFEVMILGSLNKPKMARWHR